MSGEAGKPNAHQALGEARPDDTDDTDEWVGYINTEHPYQRMLRWCGPYVSSAPGSVAKSSPYAMLSWAAGLAGALQFATRFSTFVPTFANSRDSWFLGAAVVSEVPILLVIALALTRPRQRIALLIVRITAAVLLAVAVVMAMWTAVRFVDQPDLVDGAGYPLLFSLMVVNLVAIPLALWTLAFRR